MRSLPFGVCLLYVFIDSCQLSIRLQFRNNGVKQLNSVVAILSGAPSPVKSRQKQGFLGEIKATGGGGGRKTEGGDRGGTTSIN